VVALVGMSRGFQASWESGMKSRGTDIVVNNMGSALMPKQFPEEARDRIAGIPHIAATSAILVDLMSIENSEMMFVSARDWGAFTWNNLKVLTGRLPSGPTERAVVLGQTAAEVLKKKVGDTVQLEAEELAVVGIVDGGAGGGKRLGDPLASSFSGDHRRAGQDQYHRYPRDSPTPRKQTSRSSAGRSTHGFPKPKP
jgi:putative ABC transport system permease protein